MGSIALSLKRPVIGDLSDDSGPFSYLIDADLTKVWYRLGSVLQRLIMTRLLEA